MRADRLVSLLLLLQLRQRATAQELAELLEVSERTIYRDIQALSVAGVPVYGEAGHAGGFRLVDGYRTELTGLTRREAESLFLTGLPAAAQTLGLGAAVSGAQLKLRAALPHPLRADADNLRRKFHLDALGWYQDSDQMTHLSAIADAVLRQRQLRIRYLRWDKPRDVGRTVNPYGIVLKGGNWYLVGDSRDAVRTYRISRINECETTGETFAIPATFDLADHWRKYLTEFDTRRHRATAIVRLTPRAMDHLHFLVEPAVAQSALRSATTQKDGWSRVVVPIENYDQAARDFLRLGADAEVISPVGLRRRIAQNVAAMQTYYHAGPVR